MPGKSTHAIIGAATGAAGYLFMANRLQRPAIPSEFALAMAVGAAVGVMPDAFEPAIHPWHRSFGHSLTLGTGLASLAIQGCADESSWSELAKVIAAVVVASYLSHLVVDAFTPRGLPLLK